MCLLVYRLSNSLISVLTRIRYRAWLRILARPNAIELLDGRK